MSRTSAFLRRICSAKYDNKTQVFTSMNIKVCEFESLIRGQDKLLLTKESALANSFLFISFFQRIKLVCGIVLSLILWKFLHCNCLSIQTIVFVVSRSTDEQTAPHGDKTLRMGGVISFIRFNPFSDFPASLLCFQVILFRETNPISI